MSKSLIFYYDIPIDIYENKVTQYKHE